MYEFGLVHIGHKYDLLFVKYQCQVYLVLYQYYTARTHSLQLLMGILDVMRH